MNRPQCVLDRCFELFRANRFEDAHETASLGLERFPEDGKLWQLRGMIRHRLRDFDAAGNDLETASLLVPLEPSARCALADCHVKAGEKTLARDLYVHLADDPKCPVELLPAVASGLGALSEYRPALETCRTLARRDPARHEAHFGMAYYLRRLGHPMDSILIHVSRAHELSPATPLYRITLASLLDHFGRRDEAQELLRDLDPKAINCACCLRRISSIFRGSEQ
ncbi:MAG: hypothetical protein ABS79_01345 [Planctomycetes bacterium SCN 63-9]|nr:MAG: hypothetical protein ABS79_01345 [Planctomycetes bacterium SCN 63-9]